MGIVLNQSQVQAAVHFKGPMLVLAGPGSGKTTVILYRIKNLIYHYGVKPQEIAVVTYTKAAAEEMKKRFFQMDPNIAGVSFATFHSLFFRIIRQNGHYNLNSLLKEEEKWNLIREIIRELEVETNDEEETAGNFISEYSFIKNNMTPIREFHPQTFPQDEFARIYHKYENYKARVDKIDFDDMLTECFELLSRDRQVCEAWRQKYPFILVDEFQDINRVQYECTKLLSAPQNNIFVVGDDDQSIYGFRGARPDFMLHFPREFPECNKVVLETNYRSSDAIIRLSARVIQQNQNRFDKKITGTGRKGLPASFFSVEDVSKESFRIAEKVREIEEKGVPLKEIAVIFRTNTQAGNIARAFTANAVPFRFKDAMPNVFEHWIVKDLLAYVILSLDRQNNAAFERIVNRPKRYISKALLTELRNRSGSALKNIFLLHDLKTWQSAHIVSLNQHLDQIQRRSPVEALRYIRNVVGYDEYLAEYAQFRKASFTGLREVTEEVTQAAADAKSLEELPDYMKSLSQSLKESSRESKQKNLNENAVTLSTMHGAKGLEFEAVFLPSLIEGIIPHDKSMSAQDLEEERRLFYVSITRAKTYLFFSEIQKRYEKETERSRFLVELGLQKIKPQNEKNKEIKKRNKGN